MNQPSGARDLTRSIRRAWALVGWVGVATVIYLSLMPRPPELGLGFEHGNRVGHVVAYALLTLWFGQLAVDPSQPVRFAGYLFALAIGLEFAQLATPSRTHSYADMAAGGIGAAIGWVLAPPRMPNLLCLVQRIGKRSAGG